jgi:hypothetical protein
MPARAPASIDMLQSVSRPSIDRPRIALPAYSITCPAAPAAPIVAMMCRITSLAVTPMPSSPSTVMRIVAGLRCHSVCVASTCATSVMPIPKASAPSAPWVEVWLSPQTMSMPGWLKPCSGPMTCTMPWPSSLQAEEADAVLGGVALKRLHHRAQRRVRNGRDVAGVGRHVVVGRAEDALGRARLQPATAQHLEGRFAAVVDQVPVDIEQRLPVGTFEHAVAVPDLLEHGARRGSVLGRHRSAHPPACAARSRRR